MVKTEGLEKHLLRDYIKDFSGLAEMRLNLEPKESETEGFGVS